MSQFCRRWNRGRILWGLLLGLLLAGCTADGLSDKRILQYLNQEGFGKRYIGNAEEQNYVTIGDSIHFEDTYNPELFAGTAIVDIDGTILIPEAGSVFVAGMTRSELESFLTQKISPYFADSDVKVDILTGDQRAYYVWGEVAVPGRKVFRGDFTVFEAVLAAQPEEFTANLGRVRLIRADPRNPLIVPIDVPAMWEEGDSTFNMRIKEYDIIYVPPTFLKQVADLISAIIVPIVSPFNSIINAIFTLENGGNRRNRRGRGRRFN